MTGYDYSSYNDFVKNILKEKNLFDTFKRNPLYTEMLEHVDERMGVKYLLSIWEHFQTNDEDIEAFCKLNDTIGSPIQYNYSATLTCSPTSLRYIFQSNLILSYIKSLGLSEIPIVELGGGYGGLFLALHYFASKYSIHIRKYSIVDLKAPSELQQRYLSNHDISIPISFHDASNFGEDVEGDTLFFVSCYCFSEISDEFQKRYRQFLLPRCNHGFIAWNMIEIYDIGKELIVTQEIPEETGPKNKFVFFLRKKK